MQKVKQPMTFPRMIVTETQKVAQTRCTSFLRQSEKYEILEAFLGGKKTKTKTKQIGKKPSENFSWGLCQNGLCLLWMICHCTKKTSCTYSISLG